MNGVRIVAVSIVALLLASSCATTSLRDRSPEARNKQVVQRYFEEMWNGGKPELIDELVAADYVHHPSAGEDGHGPGYVANIVATLRSAFPDVRFTVEAMVAEGDLVATRVTMTGTHRGAFGGIEPTGRPVRRKEMLMHRVAGGKLVEGWSLPDRKGLLDQLQAP